MRRSETLLALLGFAVLVPLFFLPRLLTPPGLFFGALQEQYYLMGQYAYEHQTLRALAAGYFPLWNPYNALGHPFLGDMLSAILFPLRLFLYLVPTTVTREALLLFRLFLAAFFAYAYARQRLRISASILAAVAFAGTGYFQFFIAENYLNAETLLPLLLLLCDRLRTRGRPLDLALLGLAFFAVFTNGHPEAAFYVTLFVTLYFIFAAPVFHAPDLPGAQVFKAPGLQGAQVFHAPDLQGAQVFKAPGLQGAQVFHSPDLQGAQVFNLRFLAALLIGLLLASPMLIPFLEYWPRSYHFHLPGAGFYHYNLRELAALISPWIFPSPAPGAAYYHPIVWHWEIAAQGIPPAAATVVPWLIPFAGAIPLLFALVALVRPARLSRRNLFFAAWSVFFLAVMFGLPGFRLLGRLPVFNFSGNFKHPMPEVALALAYLAGVGLDAILSRFQARAWRRALAAAALVLLLIELHLDGRWLKPFNPGYLDNLRHTAAIRRLQAEPEPFRAYVADRLLPPNLNLYFRFADVRVMDGINDRRLVAEINDLNGHDRTQAGNYWYQEVGYLQPRPEALGSHVLDLWNLKYVLAASTGHTATVIPSGFEPVSREPFAGGELVLWRRPRALPRAWFAADPKQEPSGEAQVASYSAERVELKVQPSVPGYVVLADLCYPGWEAEVNGRPVRIERVHGLLRAVPVPAEPSQVVFRYRPISFAVGLWTALTTGLALTLVTVISSWQKRFAL